MSDSRAPEKFSLEWFVKQSREAAEHVAELRNVYPGCFDEHGRPIVASATMPRLGAPR